ncbi:hypothetical protein BJX70DRAFT_403863 [Aspergillus crustosus]
METGDESLGAGIKARRDAKCATLAPELLNDATFLALLTHTDEDGIETRLNTLASVLQQAAGAAVQMMAHMPVLKFETLYHFPDFFVASSGMVKPCPHCLTYDKPSPEQHDGCQLLGICNPYILRTGNKEKSGEAKIEFILKASAFVESDSSEESPPAGAEKKEEQAVKPCASSP